MYGKRGNEVDKIKSAIAVLAADYLCAPDVAVAKMAIHIGFGGAFTISHAAIRKGTLNNIYYECYSDGHTVPTGHAIDDIHWGRVNNIYYGYGKYREDSATPYFYPSLLAAQGGCEEKLMKVS